MIKSVRDQTIALGGVFQACSLVKALASHGRPTDPALEATLHSLFKVDAESVADVYGGLSGVALGLRTLVEQLDYQPRTTRDLEVTRYVLALVYLERKLIKKTKLMDRLADGIKAASTQADFFSRTHVNVVARLADLYKNTVSTLSPRIMVRGEPEILSNSDNANLIRALLLSGMRAAILWRQCGGSRWHFLFSRRKIVGEAKALLAEIKMGLH